MQGDRIVIVKEETIRKILADKFKVNASQVQLRYKPQGDTDVISGVITMKENQVKRYGAEIHNQQNKKEE